MILNIVVWAVLGAIIGWLASYLTSESRTSAGVISGVVGAVIGGGITAMVDPTPLVSFDLTSFAVALIASVVLVGIVHAFQSDDAVEHRLQH